MDHGSTAYTGPPEGILHTEKIMKSLAGNPAEGKKPETNKNKDSEEVEGENTDEGLVKEEEKEVGVVKLHVYKSYWLAIGHCLATSILLSLFLMQGNVTIFNGGKNNFQWSIERIWECIVYILLCPVISLVKLAPLSQPIRCRTKTIDDLVARVFPRFWRFFYLEFSLVPRSIFLSSDWPL